MNSSGLLGDPGVVRGDMVGHVVQDEPHPAIGQCGAGRGQARRAAEGGVDDIAPHAVRRADDVGGLQIRQRGAEISPERRVVVRDGESGRAALPDAHQPDGVDARRRDGRPIGGGQIGQASAGRPARRDRSSSHDRGVDLIDHRALRPASWLACSPRTAGRGHAVRCRARARSIDRGAPRTAASTRRRPGPAGLVTGADAGSVVAVEVLVRTRSGPASAGRVAKIDWPP